LWLLQARVLLLLLLALVLLHSHREVLASALAAG
jgi:hypothetical protein